MSGRYSSLGKGLGERALDACIAVAIGATALYTAVWLIQQVWVWLVGIGLVAGLVAALVWRWRRW
jgi:hypothetical protein